ncbi:Zinc transporter ZitB [Vibrio mediterranei]|jgi:predicted Co/Zn/Cd cation transporter (cation efflux family)|uniref:cation transporter n=1 Tax=Vibrio mediterranei TaxID=689 RepID=UPI0007820587|nr:cation transporter [Vibrio mediterranei]MCG9789109.1 cation transporter [Vibrio mediterranei]NOH28447.1 cation transporter [Vibrio mediterranei]NUW74689.1 cation transporter [Vibrio mediterranei]SBO08526.1 Zinc transporter ZitB [Vibrio mediterranei]
MTRITESKALIYSAVGAGLLALWGGLMAMISGSSAILLDASFNLLSAVVSFASLRIAKLTESGTSRNYPMGFFAFEPLIVVIKGITILILIAFAVGSNIPVILAGGREPALSLMAIYVFPAVALCAFLYWICHLGHKQSNSDILKAEKNAWFINGIISGAIGVALILVMLIQGTSFGWVARYIDQILVVLFSLAFISDPIKLIKNGMRELTLAMPPIEHTKPIYRGLKGLAQEYEIEIVDIFIAKLGRKTWVSVYVDPKRESMTFKSYERFVDDLRAKVDKPYTMTEVDVILKRSPTAASETNLVHD